MPLLNPHEQIPPMTDASQSKGVSKRLGFRERLGFLNFVELGFCVSSVKCFNTMVLFIETLVWSASQALKYTIPYGAPYST